MTAPKKEYAPSVCTQGKWSNKNKYYRRGIAAGYTKKDFWKYGGLISSTAKYTPHQVMIDSSGRITERHFQTIVYDSSSRERNYRVVEIKQGQEVISLGKHGRQKVVTAKIATRMYAARDAKQSAAIRQKLVSEGKRDPYPTAYYVTTYKGKTYKHKDADWKVPEYRKDLAEYNKAVGISAAKVIKKSPGGIVEKEVTLTPRPGISGMHPIQPKIQMKVPIDPKKEAEPDLFMSTLKSQANPLKTPTASTALKLYEAETKAETFLGEKSGVSPWLKETSESQLKKGDTTVNSFSKALKEFSQGSKPVPDSMIDKIHSRDSDKVSNHIFTHTGKGVEKVKKSFVLAGLGAKVGTYYLTGGLTNAAHSMSKYPLRSAVVYRGAGKAMGLIGKGTVAASHWAYPSMRLTTQAAIAKGVPTALVAGGIGLHSWAQPTTHGKVKTALGDIGGLMAIYGARKAIGGAKTGYRLLTKDYYRMHELDPTRSYGFAKRESIISHKTPPRLKPTFESTLKKTNFIGKLPKDIKVQTYTKEDIFVKQFLKERGAVLRGGRNFYSQLQGSHSTKGKDWDVGMFDNKRQAQELARQLNIHFKTSDYKAQTKRLATTVKAGSRDVADIVPLKKAELKDTIFTGEGMRLESLKKATWRYYTTFYEPATTTGRSREKDLFKFMDALKHTQHGIKEDPFYYEDVAWHAGESLPHIKKGTFKAKQMTPSAYETRTGQAGKKITFFGQDEFIHSFKKSGQDAIRLSGKDIPFMRRQQLPKQFHHPVKGKIAGDIQSKAYLRWAEKNPGKIIPSPQTITGRTWKGASTLNVEKEWIMMGDIPKLKYSGWGYDYWDKKPVRIITQGSRSTPAAQKLKTNVPKFLKDISSQKSLSKDIAFSIKTTPDKSLSPLQKSYLESRRNLDYRSSFLPILAQGRTSAPMARTQTLSRDIFRGSSRPSAPMYRQSRQIFSQPRRQPIIRSTQRPAPRQSNPMREIYQDTRRVQPREPYRDTRTPARDPLRDIYRTVTPRDPRTPSRDPPPRRPPPPRDPPRRPPPQPRDPRRPMDPRRPTRPTYPIRPQYPTRPQQPQIPIIPFGTSSSKQRTQQGFDVFVRVRGKFQKVSQSPMSRAMGMSLGARKVHTSPAATFTLRKSGTVIRKRKHDPFFSQVQGRFRKKGSLFIEKSKHRISTRGEKAGITAKGIAASRKKKKKNLWW